jgi:hypothetical protein
LPLMRLPLRGSCSHFSASRRHRCVLRSGDLFDDSPNEDAVTPQSSFSGSRKLDPDSALRIHNQQRARAPPPLCAQGGGGALSWRLGAGGFLPCRQPELFVAAGGVLTRSSRRRERRRPRPGRARGGSALPRKSRVGHVAGREPLRCAGPSDSSEGRCLQEACALPWPGASPFEASRGRGPGSAQFARRCRTTVPRQLGNAQCARGCPGHSVLHGSSVSKSMKPRNEATAGCPQNVRSSFAAGPDVAAASQTRIKSASVSVNGCAQRVPPRLKETTYFGKVRRFMSLDRTVCRVGRLRSSTGVAKSVPAADMSCLLPKPQPALQVGLVVDPPGLRSPSCVGLSLP